MREQDIYKQFSKILAEIDEIKKDLQEILKNDLAEQEIEARNELNKAITKGYIK